MSDYAIEFDEQRSRRLAEAFEAIKTSESKAQDQALAELEETDERLRRLVIAHGQLGQALLCYWGMPPQAAIAWAYQAADNAIHAALLADQREPSTNHHRKLEAFKSAFAHRVDSGLLDRLAETRALWNEVRYDRTVISRETAQRAVNLAFELFDACEALVAELLGKAAPELRQELTRIYDKVRLALPVRSDAAMEQIEYYNVAREQELQSRGLSGMAAQAAGGGRDVWLEMAANQSWVREMIEDDEELAGHLLSLYKSFHRVVTTIAARRLEEKVDGGAEPPEDPEEWMSPLDFDLTCVLSYAGLSTIHELRRLIAADAASRGDQSAV